jgi:hypothetical protein
MRKIVLISVLLVLSAFSAQATVIDIVPSNQMVNFGDPVQAALMISGLGDFAAPSLGAFDIDVFFDASFLSFKSASFGDPVLGDQLDLFGFGSLTGALSVPGSVNLFEVSFDFPFDLDAFQSGSFVLATLLFDTIAAGDSTISMNVNDLADSLGAPLSATVGSGTISVNPPAVPEPGSAALLLIGLVGAGLAKRRH